MVFPKEEDKFGKLKEAELQEKLYEELVNIFGSKGGADLKKLSTAVSKGVYEGMYEHVYDQITALTGSAAGAGASSGDTTGGSSGTP